MQKSKIEDKMSKFKNRKPRKICKNTAKGEKSQKFWQNYIKRGNFKKKMILTRSNNFDNHDLLSYQCEITEFVEEFGWKILNYDAKLSPVVMC